MYPSDCCVERPQKSPSPVRPYHDYDGEGCAFIVGTGVVWMRRGAPCGRPRPLRSPLPYISVVIVGTGVVSCADVVVRTWLVSGSFRGAAGPPFCLWYGSPISRSTLKPAKSRPACILPERRRACVSTIMDVALTPGINRGKKPCLKRDMVCEEYENAWNWSAAASTWRASLGAARNYR